MKTGGDTCQRMPTQREAQPAAHGEDSMGEVGEDVVLSWLAIGEGWCNSSHPKVSPPCVPNPVLQKELIPLRVHCQRFLFWIVYSACIHLSGVICY